VAVKTPWPARQTAKRSRRQQASKMSIEVTKRKERTRKSFLTLLRSLSKEGGVGEEALVEIDTSDSSWRRHFGSSGCCTKREWGEVRVVSVSRACFIGWGGERRGHLRRWGSSSGGGRPLKLSRALGVVGPGGKGVRRCECATAH
jgi:hypothetical protein